MRTDHVPTRQRSSPGLALSNFMVVSARGAARCTLRIRVPWTVRDSTARDASHVLISAIASVSGEIPETESFVITIAVPVGKPITF